MHMELRIDRDVGRAGAAARGRDRRSRRGVHRPPLDRQRRASGCTFVWGRRRRCRRRSRPQSFGRRAPGSRARRRASARGRDRRKRPHAAADRRGGRCGRSAAGPVADPRAGAARSAAAPCGSWAGAHRRGARYAPRDAGAPAAGRAAAAVRHRRHRQHLRRRPPGERRRARRRRHRRGDPLDRAVAPRLRAVRRDDRGLRRHVRDAGELRDHARGARRSLAASRPLRDADELRQRAVHAGDRRDGGARAARHAAQRRDVRDPVPRHQHAPHVRRPVLLAAA